MRDLTVSRHTGPLSALAADWARLADAAHPGAPFRTYPWLSAWWNFASTEGASSATGRSASPRFAWLARSRDPHVLVAREGGILVGILPLYAEAAPPGGTRRPA